MPVRASGLPEDTDKAERVLWSHFDGSGMVKKKLCMFMCLCVELLFDLLLISLLLC